MSVSALERKYIAAQTAYAMKCGQRDLLLSQIEKAKQGVLDLHSRLELYTKTSALLIHASAFTRDAIKAQIENLVTLSLCSITGEAYSFKIDMVSQASGWVADFKIISPSNITLDPLSSCGGGIVDICSLALRVALLELYEPRIDGPIILDENLKFLSKDYAVAAVELINAIIEKTGRQILLVTHTAEIASGADKTFQVIAQGSTSSVEVL